MIRSKLMTQKRTACRWGSIDDIQFRHGCARLNGLPRFPLLWLVIEGAAISCRAHHSGKVHSAFENQMKTKCISLLLATLAMAMLKVSAAGWWANPANWLEQRAGFRLESESTEPLMQWEFAPTPGTFRFRIAAASPDVITVVERSTDLVTWSEYARFLPGTIADGFEDTVQSGTVGAFFRVRSFTVGDLGEDACATYDRTGAMLASGLETDSATNCNYYGTPDEPGVRNAAIPDSATPIMTLRLRIHVVADDDGSNPVISSTLVPRIVDDLNRYYAPFRLQFESTSRTFPGSRFRILEDYGHFDELKRAASESPELQLNVFVSGIGSALGGLAGIGTFPWDSDALQATGGIILNARAVKDGDTLLAHEVGHCIGLWHTFHGVSEVGPACSACRENSNRSQADTVGDRCSDTLANPRNWSCGPVAGLNPCDSFPWGDDSGNVMSYSSCAGSFSPQQAGRARAWIRHRLSSWLRDGSGGTGPQSPSALRLAVEAGASVRLLWTERSADETAIEIQRSNDGSSFGALVSLSPIPGTTGSHLDASVRRSTAYWYRVRSVRRAEVSEWATAGPIAIPSETKVPAAPGPLTLSLTSAGHVRIEWRDNSPDETAFEIQRSTGGTFTTIATAPANEDRAARIVDSAVTRGATHTYRVRAKKGALNSAFSAQASLRIPSVVVPDAPVLLGCGGSSSDPTPTFRWNTVARASQLYFEIGIASGAGAEVIERRNAVLAGSQTSHIIPSLDPLTSPPRQLRWRLRAENEAGKGPWSAWCDHQYTRIQAPTLQNLCGDAVTRDSTPTFNWTLVPFATGYRFEISTSDSAAGVIARRTANLSANTTSHTVPASDPITPSTGGRRTLYWRVVAFNSESETASDWCRFIYQQ